MVVMVCSLQHTGSFCSICLQQIRTTHSAMSMLGALRHKAWVVGKHQVFRVLPPTRTYQSVKLPTLLTQKKHLFIYSLTLLMH